MPLRAKITNPSFRSSVMSFSTNNTISSTESSTGKVPKIPFDENDVHFSIHNNARYITLNRPQKLNSLNDSMVQKILPRMGEWTRSDSAQFIVIRGNGGRALCAGGDVASLASQNKEFGKAGSQLSSDFFGHEYRLNHFIATYEKPVISIMDGITMGGGIGLSVHAPFRIATETTVCAMPETLIGFFPDVGTTFFLPRLDGKLGAYLAMTGHNLKGYDSVSAGFATHYVPSNRLQELQDHLSDLKLDADNTQDTYAKINSVIDEFATGPPKDHVSFLSIEDRILVDRAFAKDTVEDIISELVSNGSPFAQATIETLKQRSPTSLKVTLVALKQGEQADFASAINQEYFIATNFMHSTEFIEGVSARLLKPTREPNWNPASLAEVTPGIVSSFIQHNPECNPKGLELIHPERTFTQYPHHMGLPSEVEIEQYVTGEDNTGRDFKVTANEVLEAFDLKYRSKFGVKQKIQEVLARKTTPDSTDDTLLDWIR
ncbi:ClpP/crotonase [Nadsonia fulvescens var. elongata DSM 6958]|uniref:3-hydroxyisobutyryl-CoA hydrolase n=1 Tax=Nadsonia fulvescens var. elongata DSM 6958 TaxID=857566 RepID=A0A1E3PJK4_9ASCO|nr:ClpP/crotonase [Nadsonia fulvescens var. elongata DSM 6958]